MQLTRDSTVAMILLALPACGRSDVDWVLLDGASGFGSGGPSGGGSSSGGVTRADSSVGPVDTGSDSSVGPVDTGSDTSVGPVDTGSGSSVGPVDTDSTGPVPVGCGNGVVEPGEQCDPGADAIGPDQACVPGCLFNVCGDAMVGPTEVCDDGNLDDDDACTSACVPAICGDGLVWQGVEECDDADGDDDDQCHDDCTRTRAIAVAVGGNHTCVLVDNGAVRCWGNGGNGRSGLGSVEVVGDDEPASAGGVLALDGPVDALVAGLSHTCVRYGDGSLGCFGRSLEGQLGYGFIEDIGDDEPPSMFGPVPLGGPASLVATRGGSFHSCARLDDGSVRCWGAAGSGRLGVPGVVMPIGDDEPAGLSPTVDVGGAVVALTTGVEHSCALLDDGSARCWGSNASGQLGLGVPGDVGDDESPAAAGAVPIGAPVTALTAGFFHTCALLDSGAVRCWGRGNNGRLGYGNTAWLGINNTPSDAGDVAVGGAVVQIAAGNAHTCALLVGGTVRCWGWAGQGQLGYGNLDDIGDDEDPQVAGDVPIGGTVVQIAADGNHTCALLDSGQVRCWGNGGDGRLGYGSVETLGDDETPAMVGDVPLFPL